MAVNSVYFLYDDEFSRMHNINIIHRSFPPTALFPCLAGCLSFSLPCPACFLDLPISSVFCLFPCPAYFCALPISLPCLFPCPAFFLALPTSLPCLFLCPAFSLSLPISVPCLFPFPAYLCALPISLTY